MIFVVPDFEKKTKKRNKQNPSETSIPHFPLSDQKVCVEVNQVDMDYFRDFVP